MKAQALPQRPPRFSPMRRSEAVAAYLFMLPWLIGFVVFTAGPMLASLYLSFTSYNVLQPPRWVGLANFTQMLGYDDMFRKALLNTLVYTALYVPLHIMVALGLALLLNARVRGVPLWRTAFYLPSITPVVAVALLWRFILNPADGALNQLLGLFGIPGPGWTSDPHWIKPGLVLMSVWTGGSAMLIYLAGLKNIPQPLYDAADVDGASPWQKFVHITLPMLSSVLFYTAVIGVIGSLQIFAQSVVLLDANGGSDNAALFYIMYLFNQGFAYFKMGYASALAWVLFVIIVALTAFQFWLSNRWVYYEGGNA